MINLTKFKLIPAILISFPGISWGTLLFFVLLSIMVYIVIDYRDLSN